MSPKTQVKEAVDPRLIKALAHPLRGHALAIFNERVASPNDIANELGEGLSQVSYHVKVLKDLGCIELVRTEQRRGAIEHYYRATMRAFMTDKDWRRLPDSIRASMSAKLVQTIFDEAAAALEGGTFDLRDDRHLSWTPMSVDEEGWESLVDVMSNALDQILTVRAASTERLAKSGEEGIPVSVSVLGFQTPGSEEMHPKRGAAKP